MNNFRYTQIVAIYDSPLGAFSAAELPCGAMALASFRQTPLLNRVLFLLSRWTPQPERVLLVESGLRSAADLFLQDLYQDERLTRVDVLTCYGSPPQSFDPAKGQVFFTHQTQSRSALFRQLSRSGYSATCLLCTGDDIMTKWKWAVALQVPAKVMIVNESADTFWLDRGHLRELKQMAHDRVGITRLMLVRLLWQALAFPFILLFLSSFAAAVHLRRWWRMPGSDSRKRYNHSV